MTIIPSNLKWPVTALVGLAAVIASTKPQASLSSAPIDPISIYGDELVFDVTRNGKPVGRNTISFSRTPDGALNVSIWLDLAVRLLGLNVYKYDYRSDAVWVDGKLSSLKASQTEDGEVSEVMVEKGENVLSVRGPAGVFTAPLEFYPTNHWNAGVLSSSQVINTLTGELSNVMIKNAGTELIEAQGKTIEATKFVYSGDVDPTVWYDKKGRWVKFRFEAKGNSLIEYQCIKCGIDNDQAVAN